MCVESSSVCLWLVLNSSAEWRFINVMKYLSDDELLWTLLSFGLYVTTCSLFTESSCDIWNTCSIIISHPCFSCLWTSNQLSGLLMWNFWVFRLLPASVIDCSVQQTCSSREVYWPLFQVLTRKPSWHLWFTRNVRRCNKCVYCIVSTTLQECYSS